ncbi:aldehyde dehydrogenase (NADP(+)) [Sphingomonas abietis]|uniref:Aldehyde dehydrogenase (NADP(+)) n=1 Tax=Sphingomonas abietis TaxID=3012344 RepID=A0ABY7NNX1_9SPHN|nr:aldehyde dehydrogenase (NADP(+)) [Sphingomonas abietis]WBO23230.1 aldehyde dehydrogenase (NADP(+)) [Sphingomonas abietis]
MINGSIFVGGQEHGGGAIFQAVDPATGAQIEPGFASASPADVESACALAEAAFESFSATTLEERAAFLEAVADRILAAKDAIVPRAVTETGLPKPRLEGEVGRTVGQLRLFASVVRQGDWLDATIDPALPDRQPLPRVDLRRANVAVGPVAVFGASNFPLAFSVAGGDTASAFAAGCPVVVKGHPAHPGTGELVARAVREAVAACGLHEGVFSYLPGPSIELGGALVADPRIKAVGFTGSRGGGLALMKIASERAEPIPVYAEMSSINPVILFPAALEARGQAIAEGFVQSLTMGAGQFCTNPGLLIGIAGEALDRFAEVAGKALESSQPVTMLTPGIHSSFEKGVAALESHEAVTVVARGCVGEGVNQARGALFTTDAASFLADPVLGHEVFGSSSVLIRCKDVAEVKQVIAGLEGQLTATLMMDEADHGLAAELVQPLARKAGRVLANGWPTGVEVSHAMVHGGPYPATSDGRTTSVGSLAIARFLRPVCFQNLPDALLPAALRSDNPWQIARRVDGTVVKA